MSQVAKTLVTIMYFDMNECLFTILFLYFRGEKMAKVMGDLATKKPKHGDRLSGVLVKRNFNYHVIAPSDLQGMPLSTQYQYHCGFASTIYSIGVWDDGA